MQIDLPINLETERLLLGALLVMEPADRDAAIHDVSEVWFADPWHRRFFAVLVRNRGRDFGATVLAELKHGDGPNDRTAWWVSQLLVDREGNSTSGRHDNWRIYASELCELYQARIAILVKLQDLQDTLDAIRTKTAAICQPAKRDAKENAGTTAVKTRIVLDGAELA